MYKFSLLGRKEYAFSEDIIVNIPMVGDIWGNDDLNSENNLMRIISLFIQTPVDLMIELDDIGVDYTQVDEYELFFVNFIAFLPIGFNEKQMALWEQINKSSWDKLFKKFDYKNIFISYEFKNTLIDKNGKVIMNKEIYNKLSDLICTMTNSTKNLEYMNVPDVSTRKYLIERARIKRQRRLEREKSNKQSKSSSALDGIILFLVNNSSFKYNFQTVKDISLYDLYSCYKQITKNLDIEGLMSGYWAGNVDLKKVPSSQLERLIL